MNGVSEITNFGAQLAIKLVIRNQEIRYHSELKYVLRHACELIYANVEILQRIAIAESRRNFSREKIHRQIQRLEAGPASADSTRKRAIQVVS